MKINFLTTISIIIFNMGILGNLFGQESNQDLNGLSKSIYEYTIKGSMGEDIKLSDYKGKKILFVNVASKCGFTSQYKGLQELYSTYSENLVILGLPCNQFGGQEPGTNEEVQEFCQMNYGVEFQITEKIEVKGDSAHPIYKWLTNKELNSNKSSSVKWNFQKYLIDENGQFVDYFLSMTKPTSEKITKYLK